MRISPSASAGCITPGFGAQVTRWLIEQRSIGALGIDTMGIDPMYLFAADAAMVLMILLSPHGRNPVPSASRARRFQLEPLMRLSPASGQWRAVTGRDWRQN